MKFKVSTKSEALDNFGGSSYISKSGVYDVVIKFASIDVAASGAESVNFNIDYNGNSQVIYGPYVQNKDGNVNEIGAKLINALAIIIGMTDGDDYEIEEEEHAVGRDNKVQTFNVITNFTDAAVKFQLQEEYSINPKSNQIQKRLVIKNFFREDGASAKEIVDNANIGKQLSIIEEKYANNVTYRDNLTAAEVDEWKKAKANAAKTGAKAPAAKPAKAKTPTSLFK